ncbi:hypothetical protein [Bacillus sp. MMSF_3328]|uniref:hypothetical protein n=1 Tax=Bacillus sp. MMSF_3328 TaxID=3047080 RepID=UPI00273D12BA|nr:hypothetical protein [Bacillus sp. MMSF_3328]
MNRLDLYEYRKFLKGRIAELIAEMEEFMEMGAEVLAKESEIELDEMEERLMQIEAEIVFRERRRFLEATI